MKNKRFTQERIENAKSDLEVFDLSLGIKLSPTVLKTQYRKLAVLVHPDKNDDENAPKCFIKLQQAYESLLELTERQNDLTERTSSHQRDGVEPNIGTKHKRKRYNDPELSTEAKFKAFSEIFGEDDLEVHSDSWKKFCNRNPSNINTSKTSNTSTTANNSYSTAYGITSTDHASHPGNTGPIPASSGVKGDATESAQSSTLHCCLLCRRQFTSQESFTRHVNHSALHQTNLKTQR